MTFTPSRYDEESDTEVHYMPGYPYVQRDQGNCPPEELALTVLGDIADIMEDANLPGASEARATYNEHSDRYDDDDDDLIESLFDLSWYPPDGVEVDWDGESGTVTTTLTAGWPLPC